MSGTDIHQKVHQAVEQVTSAAKPDPWLAQKIRVRAQGKEEHMKKKLPAGAIIVIAIMLLMTAVAAAVTNGFGLLRYFPEQAENTAFTDRIVTIGQTWEGKYFSAEIKEAVFDGSRLRFTMSVTPKEGAEQVYVMPFVKALVGGKKCETTMYLLEGAGYDDGFWVPDIEPPIKENRFDLNDMVFEVSLRDYDWLPMTTDKDVEWTLTFNVLKTDWKINYNAKYPDDSDVENWVTEEDWAWYDTERSKIQQEAQARHELLLDSYGYNLYGIITEPYLRNGTLYIEGDEDEFKLDLFTRDVFMCEEQAVFSFTADRAEIRKASERINFVLPENQIFQVSKVAATADGINIVINTRYYHTPEAFDWDQLPWMFTLKSDDQSLDDPRFSLSQECTDGATQFLTYVFECSTTKPLHSVTLVPVQRTENGTVEREDLALTIDLE